MESNTNVLVIDGKNVVMGAGQNVYTSLVASTPAQKIELFNKVNSDSLRVADFVNMTIGVKDVYIEEVKCTNETTGEQETAPRIIIFDGEGKAFQCVSFGFLNTLRKMFALLGEPSYETEHHITIKRRGEGTRKVLTFDLVD